MSFLSASARKVTDVRGFLREAASGGSIKYAAEKGARHVIYIPYVENEVTNDDGTTSKVKQPVAISGDVHEWQTADGKFKACICMHDVINKSPDGSLLNDGSCPFCDRVADAWDIYNYRKEQAEADCKLTGEERKKHMEKTLGTFADERKAKAARTYMYLLVAKFRTDASGNAVLGADKLPEYDIKVMKLSSSRVEKIQQQLANSGCELTGSEVVFEYPAVDDKRLQVSQSTTAPVFPGNRFTDKYPAVIEKINTDVAKFDWEKIDKSFPEWSGMSTAAAKNVVDAMFEKWDAYKLELQTNPNAKYLEYVTNTPVTQPSLNGAVPVIPGAAIPAPVIPGAPTGAPVIPTIPNAPTGGDANNSTGVFGNNGGITI